MTKKQIGKGLGIAGFVLSIVSVFFFIVPILLIIGEVLALIFSISQMKKKSTGLAIAGLVISITVLAGVLLWMIFIVDFFI